MYVILKVSTHLSSFIIHLFLCILYAQGHTEFLSVSQICRAVSLTSGLLFIPFLLPRTFFHDFCLLSAHLVSVWPSFLQEVFPDCSRLGYISLMCALLYWTLPWSQKMLKLHYILVISLLSGLRSPGQEPSLHFPLLYSRDIEQRLAESRS